MENETNLSGYVPVSVASAETNCAYSPRQINELCAVARIKFIPAEKSPSGKKLVCLNDVLQYAAAHPKDRYDAVWDAIKPMQGECFYVLHGFDTKLMVSNRCRVIDTTHGSVIKPSMQRDLKGNLTGYFDVGGLMQNGKSKTIKLHTLVGKTQCSNALGEKELHHIKPISRNNPKISENAAKNLLYVWRYQHEELHKLLDENKAEEYKMMIHAIQNENKQKVYKIPHPDYESDTNFEHSLYVNSHGYDQYIKGENIQVNNILMERWADIRKNTGN